MRVQAVPESMDTWVLEGNSPVFMNFINIAQKLTQWVRLKQGVFEPHLQLRKLFISNPPNLHRHIQSKTKHRSRASFAGTSSTPVVLIGGKHVAAFDRNALATWSP